MLNRVLLAAVLATGCISAHYIALKPSQIPSDGTAGVSPLRVIGSVDDASDPLPLHGSDVVFANVTSTLAEVVQRAADGWARRHAAQRIGGWELKVELLQSRADTSGPRITVELATRVTLTATLGRVHLGQTHGYCKETAVVDRTDPSPPVYTCMENMARDLAGWLEGLSP